MHVPDATEELLAVRATFRVTPGRETPAQIAGRLLQAALPRSVPAQAVDALADDLVPATEAGVSWTLTDVDVRLWFLAWSLRERAHHAASRST